MLLSGTVLKTVKCLSGSLYTLNVQIKCLITLTTAEGHDSIRALVTNQPARLKQREEGSVLFKVQVIWYLTWIKTALQIF